MAAESARLRFIVRPRGAARSRSSAALIRASVAAPTPGASWRRPSRIAASSSAARPDVERTSDVEHALRGQTEEAGRSRRSPAGSRGSARPARRCDPSRRARGASPRSPTRCRGARGPDPSGRARRPTPGWSVRAPPPGRRRARRTGSSPRARAAQRRATAGRRSRRSSGPSRPRAQLASSNTIGRWSRRSSTWYEVSTGATSLAPDARPVRDSRVGGDAPADAGRARDPALPGMARALADRGIARRRAAGRRDPRVAGSRLQPACAEPPPSRDSDRLGRLARRPDRAARRRRVHGSGDPALRVRGGRAARGRERGPGRPSNQRVVHWSGRSRADGSRRDDLSRPHPALRACPLATECPSRGTRDEPARKQGAFEGSFRQRRATVLRLVAQTRSGARRAGREAVRSLERDGLVVVDDGTVALPS